MLVLDVGMPRTVSASPHWGFQPIAYASPQRVPHTIGPALDKKDTLSLCSSRNEVFSPMPQCPNVVASGYGVVAGRIIGRTYSPTSCYPSSASRDYRSIYAQGGDKAR
jgi:hypothetical protein